MDNATRFAKQQITEATKFLRWLLDEHGTVIANPRQEQIDSYLSEGPTTRTAVLNFIRWRAAAGIGERLKTHYRSPQRRP